MVRRQSATGCENRVITANGASVPSAPNAVVLVSRQTNGQRCTELEKCQGSLRGSDVPGPHNRAAGAAPRDVLQGWQRAATSQGAGVPAQVDREPGEVRRGWLPSVVGVVCRG